MTVDGPGPGCATLTTGWLLKWNGGCRSGLGKLGNIPSGLGHLGDATSRDRTFGTEVISRPGRPECSSPSRLILLWSFSPTSPLGTCASTTGTMPLQRRRTTPGNSVPQHCHPSSNSVRRSKVGRRFLISTPGATLSGGGRSTASRRHSGCWRLPRSRLRGHLNRGSFETRQVSAIILSAGRGKCAHTRFCVL